MMKNYDFETVVDRTSIGSAKWHMMHEANPDVPHGIPPLSVADLDIPNAPEIIDGLKLYLDKVVLGYSMPTQAYYDAVTGWMRNRHDWACKQEWIVLSNGVVPAFFNAIKTFSQPGEGVIIQTPAYYPFYAAIESNDRQLIRNPLKLDGDRLAIDFDLLEKQAADSNNKILLFCSPHNPSGRVWSKSELRRVADIALANNLILISDEIHFDLIMPGQKHTVMAKIGDDICKKLILCTAPSKTFNLAGMATSNIFIPDEDLREKFKEEQAKAGFHFLTTLGYKACELAYTKGQSWLDGLLGLVWKNHLLVKDYLAQHLPAVKVFPLEGTYLQWLDCRELGKTAEQLQTINEQEAYLYFDEGDMFGEEGKGFERMNLATPTATIQAALERMVKHYS